MSLVKSKVKSVKENKAGLLSKHVVKNASVNEFIAVKDKSGYTNEQLADLIGITHRTIRNKNTKGEVFNVAQTERLRKLDLLFHEGNEIFGNQNQFNEWLQTPSYGLDYNLPSTLIKQPGGLDTVLNELSAIKFGDAV